MNKNFLTRIVLLFFGFVITALGSTIFLLSNLGSDAFTVMMQGISEIVPMSIGLINSLVSLILIIIIYCIDKRFIKVGTILSMFVIGPSMDIWTKVLSGFFNTYVTTMEIRVVSIIIGVIIVGIGVALACSVNMGTHVNDVIPVFISFKLPKLQFRIIRVVYDLSQILIGYSLGGIFGLGTVICALLLGPFLQFTIPRCEKILEQNFKIDLQKVL